MSNQKGGIELLLLVAIIFLSVMFLGGISVPNTAPTQAPVIAIKPQAQQGKSNLQLYTFGYVTPTPTVVVTKQQCQVDNQIKNDCECAPTSIDPYVRDAVVCENKVNGQCPDNDLQWQYVPGATSDCSTWPSFLQQGWGCDQNSCVYVKDLSSQYTKYIDCNPGHAICFGKPVIYLYPVVDTTLSVKLTIPGYVYISDPTIEKTNSWTSVTAHPGGKLTYRGKDYSELYYESSVTKHVVPTTGLFIKSSELKERLLQYTHQLGLLPNEQQEFLEYWMPKLEALNSPYIFFSVLTSKQKESVDHVTLSVKPNTRIEFLVYFKPVTAPYSVEDLQLPSTPPQRIGFTEVEWGGTIDY